MTIRCLTRILAVTSVAAALLAFAPPGRAQAPRFQSGVDVVIVDVNVISGGTPVATLAKRDFVLKVDGKPREIASVSVHDYRVPAGPVATASAGAPVASAPAPVPGPSTAPRAPDRTFLLFLDRGTLVHGDWRKAVKGAEAFVDALPPGDAVGVAVLPSSSLALRFDQPREKVKKDLESVLKSSYGWTEGAAPERQASFQVRDLLYNIDAVVRGISQVPGPKHLVLIGAPVLAIPEVSLDQTRARSTDDDQAGRSEAAGRAAAGAAERRMDADRQVTSSRRASSTLSSMRTIVEAAGLGRVRIHTLTLGDSTRWTSPEGRLSNNVEGSSGGGTDLGTNNLASATGGIALFPVTGDTFFNRLSRELAVSYELTFVPHPGDDDGKPHTIEVEVPNAGKVDVRARKEFVIPSGALKTQ